MSLNSNHNHNNNNNTSYGGGGNGISYHGGETGNNNNSSGGIGFIHNRSMSSSSISPSSHFTPFHTNNNNTGNYFQMDHSMYYSPQAHSSMLTMAGFDSPSTSPTNSSNVASATTATEHLDNQSVDDEEIKDQKSSDDESKVCPFYLKGECRYGERCRNLHIRLSTNKKKFDLNALERMSRIPCKYHRQGVCPFGSMCYFNHAIVDEEEEQERLSRSANRGTEVTY